MMPFCSETVWLCLAVTVVLGGMVLCKLKSPGQVGRKVVCLVGLWGVACLLSLSPFWGLLLFSLSCCFIYTYLSGQELLSVDEKAVLITGSDSGIGHALSKYLDELGFTVFAGVLDEKGSGAEELRRTCSERLSVLQMDITDPLQIKDAYSKVLEKVQNRGLWALVNNAGILGFPADGELIPMIHYKRCMAVNFFGAVEVTKAFLPLLRKSKGRLVNISSMAALVMTKINTMMLHHNIQGETVTTRAVSNVMAEFVCLPGNKFRGVPLQKLAAYGSSKAALTMFSAVMRQELSRWGVKVSVIHPGGFQTNIAGTSDMWDRLEKTMLDHLTPDVQEDYGQDYILAQRNYLRKVNTQSQPDVSPVLLDIWHAISAKSPFAFYAPGKRSYLFLCFFPLSLLAYLIIFSNRLHITCPEL